jgi:cytochrome P450
MTWALYALSIDLRVQSTLRAELLSVPTENPTMDELLALPYLDAVVRETLRVHSPVPNTIRVANNDNVIPLSKPFVDKHGVLHDGIQYVMP